MRAVAETLEQIDPQRIECEIESDREISRQMGAGDLQPVRLEIVDEHLAEAAFLAHGLLAGQRRTGRLLVFGCSRSDRTVPVGRGLEPVCAVLVTGGGAFDEPFVDPKFATIADRHDAAGGGAVLMRIDRLALRGPGDLGVTFLELLGFGHKLIGPIVLGDVVEFRQALLDARDLLDSFRGKLRRFRMNAAIFGGEAVIGVEHRLGPGPARAQFRGLGFQLLDREPADERRIIHKAFLAAAEQIASDRTARGFVDGEADKCAETRVRRHRALGQAGAAPHARRGRAGS